LRRCKAGCKKASRVGFRFVGCLRIELIDRKISGVPVASTLISTRAGGTLTTNSSKATISRHRNIYLRQSQWALLSIIYYFYRRNSTNSCLQIIEAKKLSKRSRQEKGICCRLEGSLYTGPSDHRMYGYNPKSDVYPVFSQLFSMENILKLNVVALPMIRLIQIGSS
jgi:hypothetical protein